MTCYGFKIVEDKLRLPLKPHRYLWITLNHHTLEVLSAPGLTVRSVCLTARTVNTAFSKETAEAEPIGLVGIDRSLDNVTTASSDGSCQVYDLSRATEVKARCRGIKSHFKRNDVRVRRQIFNKYGRKERYKATQLVHHVSKDIIRQAKAKQFGIVMEKLTGSGNSTAEAKAKGGTTGSA